MATTTKPLDPVAELETASAALDQVRRRIGANDPTVKVDDLHHAETAIRFARMRIDAAAEIEAEQREQARRDRIEAIRQELPAIFNTTALDEARQNLEAAADAYCREARMLQDRTGDAFNELIGLGSTPGITPMSGDGAIQAGGITYRKPSFQHQARQVMTAAFRKHFPRVEIDFGKL